MRFWTREVAGWLFIALGLFVFYKCYDLLTDPTHRIFEGASLTLVGVVIFRGGIHLLKVGTAAEVCLKAQANLDSPATAAPRLSSSPRVPERILTGRRMP
jgi:hypothetical protein